MTRRATLVPLDRSRSGAQRTSRDPRLLGSEQLAIVRVSQWIERDSRRPSDGRGGFTAIIDGNQFCYGLTVTNIDQPGAAHIHSGNAGVNGPVVITLVHPSTGDPGASSACTTANPPCWRKSPGGRRSSTSTCTRARSPEERSETS
jgi:hypothetical protein